MYVCYWHMFMFPQYKCLYYADVACYTLSSAEIVLLLLEQPFP